MNKYYYIVELQQAFMLRPDGQGGVTFRIQGCSAEDFRVEYASFGTRTAEFLQDPANTRLTYLTEAEYQEKEAKFWKYVSTKMQHFGSVTNPPITNNQ